MNYEYKSSACPEYEPLLEDSISGEIGGAAAIRLSEHLKSCAGCREAREHVALTPRLLHLAEVAADPGPGFSRAVMARIRTDRDVRAERGFWQPLVSMSWRFAATATLALAFLVAYDTTSHVQKPAQQTPTLEASSSIPDMFSPDPARVPSSRDEVLMMMVAEDEHGKH
ncbi:MAG: zf-HC2 domain-containing protein [Candidatus Acidiferrales bacterium]